VIIYHALSLYKLALSGRCARLVEDPLGLEMIVSMTASSDSIRELRSYLSAVNAIQASLYLI
jgi:hypothetical protein